MDDHAMAISAIIIHLFYSSILGSYGKWVTVKIVESTASKGNRALVLLFTGSTYESARCSLKANKLVDLLHDPTRIIWIFMEAGIGVNALLIFAAE